MTIQSKHFLAIGGTMTAVGVVCVALLITAIHFPWQPARVS
jgi:hypothetical protein